MKVLVTGHHGYIGSVLAPFLRDAGHDVHGLDVFLYRGCDFGCDRRHVPERVADVRDVTAADLAGYDAVVHLAALSNDPVGDLNPEWTYAINLEGTVSLARAAREAGVARFLFASSCSTYGASGTDDVLDEDGPQRPLTPYAESKVRAEERLSDLADSHFSPVYLRNATAYGVSPRLRLDVVLNNLVASAHTSGRILLLSDGGSWRPMVHVEDIARASLALLEAPREVVHDQAFNIGSGDQNIRIRDLAAILSARSGCEVELSSEASPDPRSYRVDFGKLERALPEFHCGWNVERGADELFSAFAEVGLTASDFAGPRFVRLRRIRELLEEKRLDGELRWIQGRELHTAPSG
jgi:nucleoside-diphosphate-sugar epimerase